jgi:hypothetical protein
MQPNCKAHRTMTQAAASSAAPHDPADAYDGQGHHRLDLEQFLPYRLSVLTNRISRGLADIYSELGSQVSWVEERTEITALVGGLGTALLLIGGLLSLRWLQQIP